MAKLDCIFCSIAAHQSPAEYVFEDDIAVGFYDIKPKAPVHVLIVPRLHLNSLNEVNDQHTEVLGQLLSRAKAIAQKLGIDQSGYRVLLNTGPDGGQEVHHLHLHLLGGKKMSF